MNFDWTDEQRMIQNSVRELMEDYPLEYWRKKDEEADFPEDFFQAVADQGFLGVMMPEEYGGAGMGLFEGMIVMKEIAASGAGTTGCSAIHMNLFGVNPLVKHGTEEQLEKYLPPIIEGNMKVAFGVTEPNAGLETPRITTHAERKNGGWVINGEKVWTSTAQEARKVLLLTRTTPYDEVEKKTKGMTLFFADLDPDYVDVQEIEKCGRAAVDSNTVHINDLPVDDADRVGDVGEGFYTILDGINPERVLIAAEAVGTGLAAIDIASDYANEREVFGRPIGKNQGIQVPLAKIYSRLKAADAMVEKAAWLYDNDRDCAEEANIAKLLAGEVGFEATDQAMQTLGGFGYAKEYHVERLWREARLFDIAPVTPELILSYVGTHVLGLPRSY